MQNINHLLVIGSQKSGTTYLSSILLQHPKIQILKNNKEPDFFTRNWDKGEEWYYSDIGKDSSVFFLDASTSYTAAFLDPEEIKNCTRKQQYFNHVPKRIAETANNIRFIYIMRDPVKRAYSSYWHNVRAGREKNKFRIAIKENSYYLRIGEYYEQLKLHLQYFKREQFLLLSFEEFVKNPVSVASKCYTFLELEEYTPVLKEKNINRSFIYPDYLQAINRITTKYGGLNKFIKKIQPAIPEKMIQYIGGKITLKIPKMEADDELWLKEYYREKNLLLQNNFDFNISHWK